MTSSQARKKKVSMGCLRKTYLLYKKLWGHRGLTTCLSSTKGEWLQPCWISEDIEKDSYKLGTFLNSKLWRIQSRKINLYLRTHPGIGKSPQPVECFDLEEAIHHRSEEMCSTTSREMHLKYSRKWSVSSMKTPQNSHREEWFYFNIQISKCSILNNIKSQSIFI